MKRNSKVLWGSLLGAAALHEVALWAVGHGDVPSVLFAPGAHTPLGYLVLCVSFVLLRLCLYFVAPCLVAAWLTLRIQAALSAAVDRRASVDASSTRASQQRSLARDYPPDPPRASHPGSST